MSLLDRSAVPASLTLALLLGGAVAAHAGGGLHFARAQRPNFTDSTGALALADLDGDGRLDLVTIGEDDDDHFALRVVRGLGDGSFLAEEEAAGPLVDFQNGLVLADLDGNGRLDAATIGTQLGQNVLRVWLDAGPGVWPPFEDAPPAVFVLNDSPDGLAAGDVDGDLDLDLVVAHASGFSAQLNAGNGTFTAGGGASVAEAGVAVLSADLDGDGLADVVLSTAAHVRVYLATGLGSFAAPTIVLADGAQSRDGLTLADLDHDGDDDLVVAGSGGVQWLPGDGLGGFGVPVVASATGLVLRVLADDLDADARPDLVLATDDSVQVLVNAGGGSFTAGPALGLKPSVHVLAAGDVNGDGRRDVVASHQGGVAVLENLGDASFPAGLDLPIPGAQQIEKPAPPALADMDGDGDLDLLTGVARRAAVHPNLGNGSTWGSPILVPLMPVGYALRRVLAADVDGDADMDAVGLSSGSGDDALVSTWLRLTPTSFAPPTTIAVGASAEDAELGDVDGDGDLDLFVANEPGFVLLLDVGAGFGAPIVQPWDCTSVALADFNGDTLLDVVIGGGGAVQVLEGQGDGTFIVRFAGGGSGKVSVGDVDEDGQPDVIVTSGESNFVSVLRSLGGFGFVNQVWSSKLIPGPPPTYHRAQAADVDGVPGAEIVLFGRGVTNHGYVVVLHQDAGVFSIQSNYAGLNATIGGELTDLDGDGDLEAVFANDANSASTVTILPGRASDPWKGLSGGLAGSNGLPELSGSGTLQPATTVGLSLVRARAAAPVVLVIGLSAVELPFKGGTLVPAPQVLVPGLSTNADGALQLAAGWPALPSGTTVVLQTWIVDAQAPAGLSASNGLMAVQP